MSPIWSILIVVGALTILGSAALLFVTVKYYWGERGAPPITGDERKRQRTQELQRRARQIQHFEKNPVVTRKPGFFDNRKG